MKRIRTLSRNRKAKMNRIEEAIAVEGRDDVAAVSRAVDALIIPTHGFGISAETWGMLQKAYEDKGLIILTDPDHAGEQIRKRLSEKFPEAIHAYVSRDDASTAGDIGIENAEPDAIWQAIETAMQRAGRDAAGSEDERLFADMNDLRDLGLTGCEGSAEARRRVTKELGIGYANGGALIKKLRGFGIDRNELKEAVQKISKKS